MNKVFLMGRLGKDVELKHTSGGLAIASFSVATSEVYKDKQGNKKESTCWHNVVTFGKLAELCDQYLNKGSQVFVEGKIDNRSYDDKDGNKKYISEIKADQVKFLDSKKEKSSDVEFTHDDIPF